MPPRALSAISLVLLLVAGLFVDFHARGGDPSQATADLQSLQGTWKGAVLTQKTPDGPWVPAAETITVTVTGDSFYFHRDTNFWFKTTIALPAGTHPQELHATIRENSASQGSNAIGKVVVAIFKIEGGTLTLAARGDGSEQTPLRFDGENVTRYELQKRSPKETISNTPAPETATDPKRAGR